MNSFFYIAVNTGRGAYLPEPSTWYPTRSLADIKLAEIVAILKTSGEKVTEAYVFERGIPRPSREEMVEAARKQRDLFWVEVENAGVMMNAISNQARSDLQNHDHDEKYRRAAVKVNTEGWWECGCGHRFPSPGYGGAMVDRLTQAQSIGKGLITAWWQNHLPQNEWRPQMSNT